MMKRLIALLLALLMLVPAYAMAEETVYTTVTEGEEPVTHIAKATVMLKVRRAPDDSAYGNDSIPRDSLVYILEYGTLWCKVRTAREEGYVSGRRAGGCA